MKKVRFITVVLVLTMIVIGASYAAWSENIPISGAMATGVLDWNFDRWGQQDDGDDYLSDPGFVNIRQVDKGVASTKVRPLNTDKNTLLVTIDNAYPGYYNNPYVTLKNTGTIPIKIQQPVVTNPNPVEVSLRWLESDADPIVGKVLMPGQYVSVYYEFRVNEPAQENSSYTFTIAFPAVQWE